MTNIKKPRTKKVLVMALAMIMVFTFTSSVFAIPNLPGRESDYGSWSSSVCLRGFTAGATLSKESTSQGWDHFYPQPHNVRYAVDNYSSSSGWINSYVVTTSGRRMSNDCTAWKHEDDNVSIYSGADSYNTLKVRIENQEYYGVHNMRSEGSFQAQYYR